MSSDEMVQLYTLAGVFAVGAIAIFVVRSLRTSTFPKAQELYKDEVRKVARALGLPEELAERQPFPGPALAIRVVGAPLTKENVDVVREANYIWESTIENAFKHGVNISAKSPIIQVDLSMDEQYTLHFSCQNLKDTFPEAEIHSGGIGLENVRKRLELIYPGKHEFMIEENDDQYTVIVKLELGESER